MLSCPTGSIGTTGVNLASIVKNDFPLPIEGDVFYCGFNSQKSYGGNSYFIRHPAGNWLIDSPKFLPHLVRKLEELGGMSHIFLTHRDDVADAERYAKHFAARRIIHRRELSSQPGAEIVLEGESDAAFGPDFLVIPTPGHTAGHCAAFVSQPLSLRGRSSRLGPRLASASFLRELLLVFLGRTNQVGSPAA